MAGMLIISFSAVSPLTTYLIVTAWYSLSGATKSKYTMSCVMLSIALNAVSKKAWALSLPVMMGLLAYCNSMSGVKKFSTECFASSVAVDLWKSRSHDSMASRVVRAGLMEAMMVVLYTSCDASKADGEDWLDRVSQRPVLFMRPRSYSYFNAGSLTASGPINQPTDPLT